jgi:hypothetical protein
MLRAMNMGHRTQHKGRQMAVTRKEKKDGITTSIKDRKKPE